MAFDLFITISGLCLLVRREEELLVLLPKTSGDHKHHAVLGSHQRYQSEHASQAVNGFVEHSLAEQQIILDVETDHVIDTHLYGYDIATIPKAAGTLRPAFSYLQLVLTDGAPCPLGLCTHEKGATWRYLGKRNHLATELHWRIRDVISEAGGREGISMRVATKEKGTQDVVLRPVNRQLRMYLFHTIKDELPSKNPPPPNFLVPNDPAPHFCHYYDLFSGGAPCDPPIFAPETFEKRDGSESLFLHGHIGRRYSCVVAQFDDASGA